MEPDKNIKSTNKAFTIRFDENPELVVLKFFNGAKTKEMTIAPELVGPGMIPLTEIFD